MFACSIMSRCVTVRNALTIELLKGSSGELTDLNQKVLTMQWPQTDQWWFNKMVLTSRRHRITILWLKFRISHVYPENIMFSRVVTWISIDKKEFAPHSNPYLVHKPVVFSLKIEMSKLSGSRLKWECEWFQHMSLESETRSSLSWCIIHSHITSAIAL